MTDTHVDMKYAVGAVATGCREPLCCRENQNKPNKQSISAGPWGAYNHCDIPWNTVRNMLETLAGRHKVVYIHKTTRAKIVQNCSLHGFMWQHFWGIGFVPNCIGTFLTQIISKSLPVFL